MHVPYSHQKHFNEQTQITFREFTYTHSQLYSVCTGSTIYLFVFVVTVKLCVLLKYCQSYLVSISKLIAISGGRANLYKTAQSTKELLYTECNTSTTFLSILNEFDIFVFCKSLKLEKYFFFRR